MLCGLWIVDCGLRIVDCRLQIDLCTLLEIIGSSGPVHYQAGRREGGGER